MMDFFANAGSSIEIVPLSRLFLIFLLYSFIGWCCEVLYVGIFYEHKFVNRGFLHGPVCPIYGYGGLIIMLLPHEVKSSWITLFVSAMVLCSAVEYFASWEMEKMFKMKWWDYSDHKFNIKGRICLLNSVLFGVMGIISVHFVQPVVDRFVLKLNDTSTVYLAAGFGVVFIIDNIATVHGLVDFSTTMAKLKEFGEALSELYSGESWFRGASMTEMFASVKERASVEKEKFSNGLLQKIDFFNAHHPNEERLVIRFPRLTSISYMKSLGLVKQHIMDSIAERKAELAMKKHKSK
ncbi:MAG TPA: hypothetical protein DCL73_16830 [Treponema sp.]|nr:hypothetical protein [Treponema sp.]